MNSFDPDHAMAILLQAKFNEEAKKQRKNDKENLPMPVQKPMVKNLTGGPQNGRLWTPVQTSMGCFVTFNKRFFWGQLVGVEVKWSPQMTFTIHGAVFVTFNKRFFWGQLVGVEVKWKWSPQMTS
ncbi:DNA-dependent metalloprotease SPRTN-like, partial [Homalodisca vitripennis]|uniref:DNA-dependent metalloprotease SPRTN-like n=1 Tax=Homalodisca vitripennis TaxID=197043 RepID=UPI001EECDC96